MQPRRDEPAIRLHCIIPYADLPRLNGLCQSYVDACNWSLVFDADYYKKAFPIPALQYDYDDALLLQHFQTVGVHQGRQGSEGFSVAAYKANCGSDIQETLGGDYECHYFYCMLNQASEKSVDAKNSGKYPMSEQVKANRVYLSLKQ